MTPGEKITTENADGWIEPPFKIAFEVGQRVDLKFRDGEVIKDQRPRDYDWQSSPNNDAPDDIIAYRHSRPEETPPPPGGEGGRGWLIEKWSSVTGAFAAEWWALHDSFEDGRDWTKDSTIALLFARERDAAAYIEDIGWTEAKPTEHAWPALTTTPAGPDYAGHGKEMEEALRAADQFITNGVELGYIRLPDAGSNDPALKTPGLIRAILSNLKGEA